ncbi:gibberellin 2-oxidase protein [Dioscorea alata]|uniref:Gibberellin 2-oxidase protein n=1 Tax=Dioscorea alata TaxID=55571 RepID=A0ACB7UUL9_DIOAL|nr:gibberellin 2-oxidase protein [Dioscorea alata]
MLSYNNICDPPFASQYKAFFYDLNKVQQHLNNQDHEVKEECELPLIDLRSLKSNDKDERHTCMQVMAKASSEWGFFQVLNHEISPTLLGEIRNEQIKMFKMPFEKKATGLLSDSYRWGTPTATSVTQFSWSEAFHVPLNRIFDENCWNEEVSSLRDVMEKLAGAMSELACLIAGVLAENLGYSGHSFLENCNKNTCFIRLNRYPPCPFSPEPFGLTPHTDSDFLTILYQDQVGGLQLMKDSKWVAVKPNPHALIVNIGDLFQAWSNDIYKSVEHKVMVNRKVDRYSVAYFLCPSYESTIGSCKKSSPYKSFTFGEFRQQVQEDVKRNGQKVGLCCSISL